MAEDTKAKWVPPYIAFATLTGLIERMQNEGGPPSRIDRSYLDTLSGGYQSQVLAALKALDLMGPQGEVTPILIALVESSDADTRKATFADILARKYPRPVSLGTTKATQGQLEEAFREYGITGDTLRKAIAFYLNAAKYAGVPVSANFRVPSVVPSGTRRQRRALRHEGDVSTDSGGDQGEPGPSWTDTIDPAIAAWLRRIPEQGTPWSSADRERWHTVLKAIMDGIYSDDG